MRILVTVLAVMLIAPAAAAAQEDDWRSPKLRIEWAEFKKLHDAGNVVIVDVRDAVAFETARIPGSVNVPLAEIEKRLDDLRKYKKPIVFYCA